MGVLSRRPRTLSVVGRIVHGMHPDTALDIRLSAIITRGQFTTDPATIIAELRAVAGARVDVLHGTVGTWVGYFGGDEHLSALTDALLTEFGLDALRPGIEVGRSRRGGGPRTPPPPQE